MPAFFPSIKLSWIIFDDKRNKYNPKIAMQIKKSESIKSFFSTFFNKTTKDNTLKTLKNPTFNGVKKRQKIKGNDK